MSLTLGALASFPAADGAGAFRRGQDRSGSPTRLSKEVGLARSSTAMPPPVGVRLPIQVQPVVPENLLSYGPRKGEGSAVGSGA